MPCIFTRSLRSRRTPYRSSQSMSLTCEEYPDNSISSSTISTASITSKDASAHHDLPRLSYARRNKVASNSLNECTRTCKDSYNKADDESSWGQFVEISDNIDETPIFRCTDEFAWRHGRFADSVSLRPCLEARMDSRWNKVSFNWNVTE